MGKPNQSPGGSPEQFSREAVERKVVPMSGPRPQTIARHKVFQERLAAIGRTARAMTRSADRYLEEELGIDVVDDKEDPLSQEEKVQYKKTVEQSVDRMGMSDAPDARRQVMDRIFTPKKFRLLYKKWEKEYGEKVKKNKEFASTVTLEDFVLEKGADYINACRSQIIKGRTGRALDKLSGKDSDPAKEKERVDKIQDDVLQFVKRNEDEMIVFDQLEEGKKKKLRDDFVGIFLENGVDKKDKQKLLALFADIVGDVQYAVNTNVELEATLPEMIAMAGDESITDEMWNDRRQRALQKNAPELAEKPAEYGAQVYMPYGGGTGEGMSVSYESVQDMGGKGNVVLKEAPGKGRGVYELRFPYYTGILK
ncbi:MAG TPA: hypothetical protein VI588_00860, partial [Candidatus Gracilibacteria bacterium]|nr:hypothetical protein [Candidatus Gracilibacteria bacterium]